MLIGKSLTALGGGGLKPEIIVTAKAGALLNLHFKDSSIILQTYQLGAEETHHTFVVDVSETAYVIDDATNGKSVEVLVDAVAQYSVGIEYVRYLYKDGNPYDSVTGGWSYYAIDSSSVNAVTLTDTAILLRPSTKGQNTGVNMNNYVDATGYKTAYFEFEHTGTVYAGNNNWYFIVIDSDGKSVQTIPASDGVASLDISSLGDFIKVKIWIYNLQIKITKIWLE